MLYILFLGVLQLAFNTVDHKDVGATHFANHIKATFVPSLYANRYAAPLRVFNIHRHPRQRVNISTPSSVMSTVFS